MKPEADIKEKALSLGARVAGIASVDSINRYAPEGHRPDDMLKKARSVVVIGGNEPTAGAWRSGSNRVLGSIGYNRSQLASAARLKLTVAQIIEIRSIAEIEMISLEKYLDVDGTKEKRFKRAPGKI